MHGVVCADMLYMHSLFFGGLNGLNPNHLLKINIDLQERERERERERQREREKREE